MFALISVPALLQHCPGTGNDALVTQSVFLIAINLPPYNLTCQCIFVKSYFENRYFKSRSYFTSSVSWLSPVLDLT